MGSTSDSTQLTPTQIYTGAIALAGAALVIWSGINVASALVAGPGRGRSERSSKGHNRRRSQSTNEIRSDGKTTDESTVQVTYPTTLEMCDNAFYQAVSDSGGPKDTLPKIRAGALLKLIDVVAGVAARKHAELSCVTVSVDSVLLLAPIYLGDLVHLSASVNRAWGSSLEVGVRVVKEDVRSGDREYVSHAYMTFVAIASPPSGAAGSISQTPARVRLATRQVLPTSTLLSLAWFWLDTPKAKAPKVQLQALLPRTPLEARRHILAGRRRAKRISNAQKGEARDGVTTEIKKKVKEEVSLISKTGGKWKGPAETESGTWTPGKLKIDQEDLSAAAGTDVSALPGIKSSQEVELEALELEFVVQAFLSKDPAVAINEAEGMVEINLAGDVPLRHPLKIVEKLAKKVTDENTQSGPTSMFTSQVSGWDSMALPSPSAPGTTTVASYITDSSVPAPPRHVRRRSVFLPLKPTQEREGDTDVETGTPVKTAGSTIASKPQTSSKLHKPIKVAKTMSRTIHIVFPEHTNSVGVLFGGQLMDWMEEAALLSVRHVGRGKRWGTVSLDGLEFEQAVAVGESMTFTAIVIRTFVQSCEVYVIAEAESPRHGMRRITNDALFTLAFPLDDHDLATSMLGSTSDGGRHKLLRQVEMPDDSALSTFAQVAPKRRQSRLEMKQMLVRIYSDPS